MIPAEEGGCGAVHTEQNEVHVTLQTLFPSDDKRMSVLVLAFPLPVVALRMLFAFSLALPRRMNISGEIYDPSASSPQTPSAVAKNSERLTSVSPGRLSGTAAVTLCRAVRQHGGVLVKCHSV